MCQHVFVRRVLVGGTTAGVLATAAMSTVFIAADRMRLIDRKPPQIIVDHFFPTSRTNTADRTALLGHFAYGAAGGAGYAAFAYALRRSGRVNACSGFGYGLLVWAVSYEGWLPLVGVLPPAHRDRPGRAWTIVAAHIIYGISLGLLCQPADASRKVPARALGSKRSAP
ncbi:DUF6789 family protein [Subtercola boreus]|uniref:DUF6789 family protein n=1 Tax=Subtercola boreus TaxID=120213 RepID=UPI0034610813